MKTLIVIRPDPSGSPHDELFSSFSLPDSPSSEIWLVNDGSPYFGDEAAGPHVRVIDSPFKYGSGGIQKVALRHAVENGFDSVIVLGFFNRLTASAIEALTEELKKSRDEAVHLLSPNRGFRPYFYGGLLNWMAGVKITGWHSLARAYKTKSLKKIAFELNTYADHFDTEILLQLVEETPIRITAPGFSVKTPPFRFLRLINDFKSCIKFRLQKYGFFYDVRFHPELLEKAPEINIHAKPYEAKFDDFSPHSLVQKDPDLVPHGAKVLDIGCSSGYVAGQLAKLKKCEVVGVDMLPKAKLTQNGFRYVQIDLERGASEVGDLIEKGNFDVVLMLDVLEHLSSPEFFLLELFKRKYDKPPRFVFSTGNVAFAAVRAMLLLGYFNYGERGILDITHKRLFSYRTFRNLIEQTGFGIRRRFFFPLPFTKLGLSTGWAGFFEGLNRLLIMVAPTLFSYQIMFEAQMLSLPSLVQKSAPLPSHAKK